MNEKDIIFTCILILQNGSKFENVASSEIGKERFTKAKKCIEKLDRINIIWRRMRMLYPQRHNDIASENYWKLNTEMEKLYSELVEISKSDTLEGICCPALSE